MSQVWPILTISYYFDPIFYSFTHFWSLDWFWSFITINRNFDHFWPRFYRFHHIVMMFDPFYYSETILTIITILIQFSFLFFIKFLPYFYNFLPYLPNLNDFAPIDCFWQFSLNIFQLLTIFNQIATIFTIVDYFQPNFDLFYYFD